MPTRSFSDRMPDELLPAPFVLGQEVLERLPAIRAEAARVEDAVVAWRQPTVDLRVHRVLALQRDQVQRVLVHRAPLDGLVPDRVEVRLPPERVERAFRLARVLLGALLEEARDGGLRRAHRAVQEQDALFRPVAEGGGLDVVDEPHERGIEAEHGVAPVVHGIVEEPIVRVALVLAGVLRHPVREDHVVEPLVGVTRHPRAPCSRRACPSSAARDIPGDLAFA